MSKWYEDILTEKGVVISSRIRLARNIKKYPFCVKISNEKSREMIKEIEDLFETSDNELIKDLKYISVTDLGDKIKMSMMEKHIISPAFTQKEQPCGVFLSSDESISIMVNEEDHIRIQTISPGDDIDYAFKIADKIDDIIESKTEYAFDENYGYLTSCPTNIGTGLRASFMMHLPALEKSGQIKNIIGAVSKFGVTVRGIYGEGSESMGSIYQISNQITLGQSEREIIRNLKSISNQIIEQEIKLRSNILNDFRLDFSDKVYRAYGIITNARKLEAKEAVEYLSRIREGYLTGVLNKPKPKTNIYNLIMNVQPGSLESAIKGSEQMEKKQLDCIRAEYLKQQF